jgi:hypothetical protein
MNTTTLKVSDMQSAEKKSTQPMEKKSTQPIKSSAAVGDETIARAQLLQLLNEQKFLETRKMSDLTVGASYLIEKANRITTKYGEAILVTLSSANDRFKVFLPKRFAGMLSDQSIAHLEDTRMKYLGGEYHAVEFY